MKIDNRQKLLGVIAIGAVVLWAANQLILTPLYGVWKSRAARIEKLRNDVAEGNRVLVRQKSIRDQWGTWSSNTLAPEASAAESQLNASFYRWKTVSNVSVQNTRLSWRKGEDESYRALECRADATGTLDALARFLYEIERDPLGVKVTTVDITSKDPSGSQLTLTVELNCLQLAQSKPLAQAPTQPKR